LTEDQFLDALGQREGLTYSEPPKNDQPTGPYGITLGTLKAETSGLASLDALRRLSVSDARTLAQRKLRRDTVAFGLDKITDEHLRYQLLDFAYNSGPQRAIRWLQRTLGFRRELITGVLDDRTLRLITATASPIVNNALVAARLRMLDDAVDSGTVNAKFEEGLESRALSFGVFDTR